MNKRAFTLVEILVVVGVLAILGAVSAAGFITFQRQTDLGSTAEKIISSLRSAQNKTLASEGPSRYGVYFDNTASPHQYVLFAGSSYGSRAATLDQVFRLPARVEFYEINLAGGNEVVFNRINASTDVSGNVRIRLTNDTSKTASIYIDNSGRVGLASPATPSDTRVTDSRHVHFTFNQNAQNAITLSLAFPDYPSDNYNISFQNYLNAGKTEFSWEGVVLVGPAGSKTEQRLKIHTHSLITSAAQFSIHRPLSINSSYNDKALNISLDGQELIRYAGDERGTVTPGPPSYISGFVLQ